MIEARLVAADYAQIEARVLAWLAGETRLLDAFRSGCDLYSEFGTNYLFNRPVSRATPFERQVSKEAVLGCGFGMGPQRFLDTCKRKGVEIDAALAERAVMAYRAAYPAVPRFWSQMQAAIYSLTGAAMPVQIGALSFEAGKITLPSGRCLWYHEPGQTAEGEFVFATYRRNVKSFRRLWRGLLAENVTQAVARDVIATGILRTLDLIEQRNAPAWFEPIMMTHDDLVWRVPAPAVEAFKGLVEKVMTEPVPWATGLPLAVEVKDGGDYGQI